MSVRTVLCYIDIVLSMEVLPINVPNCHELAADCGELISVVWVKACIEDWVLTAVSEKLDFLCFPVCHLDAEVGVHSHRDYQLSVF